jgi:type II secretory pathway pseudopilin PulG
MGNLRIRMSRRQAAFSLIEIILALGIISFALVGILGLFPVAIDAAADSQHETQAALIARSIFDQLEATPESPVRTVILAKTMDGGTPGPVKVDLTQSSPISPVGFDTSGAAISSAVNAPYQVQLSVEPLTTPAYGLTRVSAVVKLAGSKVTAYTFVSILRQKQ